MSDQKNGPPGAVTPEGPNDLDDLTRRPHGDVTPSWVNVTLYERGQVVKTNCQPADLMRDDADAPPGVAASPSAAPGRLPCLNCPNSDGQDAEILREAAFRVAPRDSDGRRKVDTDEGQIWLGGVSQRERKSAFALVENLRYLAGLYGVEFLGFLTLTFKENLTDFREAQRRFNNATRKLLRKHFRDWVVTVEPQGRGAVHYHLVVVCRHDIRTGFDFEAIGRSDYRSASSDLRAIWKDLRQRLPRYGFGRSELLPVKSTGEGIAKYVGKYLEKGSAFRGDQFRGARMVRYSQGWRRASSEFAWVAPGAMRWRKFVGDVAALLGASSIEEMNTRFGRFWSWKLLFLLQESVEEVTAAQAAQMLGQEEP